MNFWKSTATAPILGVPSKGSLNLGQSIQQIVPQLAADANPREAPRLPTMARTENLLAVQVLKDPDPFRHMLTGGWLAREADSHSYKSANPGGVSNKEEHAPGISSSQLGFDLWVAALHRCRPVVPVGDLANVQNLSNLPNNWVFLHTAASSNQPAPPLPAGYQSTCGAVLQTVPSFVETPEMGLLPHDDVQCVVDWISKQLGSIVNTGNDAELHRQMTREVRSSKYGRRDAQWALCRTLCHARQLVYIETPLLARTAHPEGKPTDSDAAVDLVDELISRLKAEPGLRVVILILRNFVFPPSFAPWAMCFYAARSTAAQALQLAAGTIGGRQRVVVAHPMSIPGRPLVIRTTTVIVDDVWCLVGTSSISRRGLTFDGANDVVMTDRALDRGASVSIRNYRKALMASHLGLAIAQPVPPAQLVQPHQPAAAHSVFADVLANGGEGSYCRSGPAPIRRPPWRIHRTLPIPTTAAVPPSSTRWRDCWPTTPPCDERGRL